MTRADWIRGMNDKKMARLFEYFHDFAIPCDFFDADGEIRYGNPKYCMSIDCSECILGWLKEELTEDDFAEWLKEL